MINSKKESKLWYIVLGIIFLFFFIPLWWMIITSFKDFHEVYTKPYALTFSSINFNNYKTVLSILPFFTYLFNTVRISVFVCFFTLLTSSMAGYAFARLKFPFRDQLFYIYLATLMVPHQVVLIPNFLLFRVLGLLDNPASLILAKTFTAYGTFLLRQFFLGIPKELEEAAVIDGYGYFQRYLKIILPLAKPALTTLFIITLLSIWNEYLYALIFLQSESQRTLTLGLALLKGDLDVKWNEVMAATIFTISPIVVVYLSAQKYFVKGIALSGLKG